MEERNPFMVKKARPLVLGHRGVPLLHQENTLAAFHRARELGVDGVELDVRCTRDGEVVVFHDDETTRLTGVAGRIEDMTWDQVSRLRIQRDLFMGKAADGSDVVLRYEREERIPLLAEVLDELAGALAINVELKPATPNWRERHVGTRTARVIRDAAVLDSVIVTSFDFFKLHALEKEHSPIHSGFAYDDDFALVLPRWISRLPDLETQVTEIAEGESRNREALVNRLFEANRIGRWIGASVVAGEHTLIEPDSIGRFKARGTAVGTFTFFPLEMTGVRHHLSDEAQVSRLRELHEQGVDWIETDDPVRAIELLERV
ncbi:MAG: hypothetical protein KC420_21025 [Myxococcales bacterium]|nr:hypothetical protein [Myxococcales bacterium]